MTTDRDLQSMIGATVEVWEEGDSTNGSQRYGTVVDAVAIEDKPHFVVVLDG